MLKSLSRTLQLGWKAAGFRVVEVWGEVEILKCFAEMFRLPVSVGAEPNDLLFP